MGMIRGTAPPVANAAGMPEATHDAMRGRTRDRPVEETRPAVLERDADYAPEKLAEALRPLANPVRLRLLRYLTEPHYLEEVASHLGFTRQGAKKHLDMLVRIGVLERRSGVRRTGPVTEYLLNPRAVFLIRDEFEQLGALRARSQGGPLHPTTTNRRPPSAGARGVRPCVVVLHGPDPGRATPLAHETGREWTIGRDRRCDILVDHDPFASNRHAALRWDGRSFVLTDLRATNGTHHNWNPLARGGEAVLRTGDVLGVGRTTLLFWE